MVRLMSWSIKIQKDGTPAVITTNIMRTLVFTPEDIAITDEGIVFKDEEGTDYKCKFDDLSYLYPPTPVEKLREMNCIDVDVLPRHRLCFLYEFISGVLVEENPYIKRKSKFDIQELAARYDIHGVDFGKMKELILNRRNRVCF